MADITEYISQAEFSRKEELSRERISQLIHAGKISDVIRIGRETLIHKDAYIIRKKKLRKDGKERDVAMWPVRKDLMDAVRREAEQCNMTYSVMLEHILLERYKEVIGG